MSSLRTVLFDFGGTLYDYDSLEPGDRESIAALARELAIDASDDEIRRAQRKGLRVAFERYRRQPFYLHAHLFRDAVDEMAAAFGKAVTAAQHHRYRDHQWSLQRRDFRLRDGVLETLAKIRRRGLHLGIVSNIDRDMLDHLMEIAGIAGWFDSLLTSEEVGSCKPDPGIFAEALRRAGCTANEALFVGDSVDADIQGGRNAGMRTALLWHREDRLPPDEPAKADHVIRRVPDLLPILDLPPMREVLR